MAEQGSSSSAPNVQLPLISDSEEEHLFGSEDETDLAAASRAQPALSPPSTDAERDLLGSVSPPTPLNELKIFGPPRKNLPGQDAPTEPRELDEREIFGDIPDEDLVSRDVDIRRRPAPSDDRIFKSLRLPNVITVEKAPFDATNIAQSLLEGYKEYKNTMDMSVVKLLNPENCIRWRFRKGADGQNLMDDDGRPQYESNARIVEWENGTKHMYIGGECFNINEIEDKAILFEENSSDIHVCHGRVVGRLVVTPSSLQSASHKALKRSQYGKFLPTRRSLLPTRESENQSTPQERFAWNPEPGMTDAFLEGEQEDTWPSNKRSKRQGQ